MARAYYAQPIGIGAHKRRHDCRPLATRAFVYHGRMLFSFDEYKKLLANQLDGLSDDEVRLWYECHTTFLAFILKKWFARNDKSDCDKLAS